MATLVTKNTNFPNGVNAPITYPANSVKSVTGNTTLTASDSGKFIMCDAADCVITLPATQDGLTYTVITNVLSTGTGTSVSPAAADKIMGMGFTAADDKDAINTGATDVGGDYIKLVGDGSLGWYIVEAKGIWARES